MSKRKFNAEFREAIWIAHNKKCAYTGELVDLATMNIDHVIPESTAANPARFAEIKASFGLGDDFDINGPENLLPAKPLHNQQKADKPFLPPNAQFFLNLAASKKLLVEKNITKIRRRLDVGRAFVIVRQLVESGKIDVAEVSGLLASPARDVFRLARKIQFADDTELNFLEKADIERLRTRPVRLGANRGFDCVTFCNDDGEERNVRTCVEYESALREGFNPSSNAELKLSYFLKHQCGLLRALSAATLPTQSFMADPKVGLADLGLIPASFFPDLGDVEESIDEASPTETYETLVEEGALIVKRVGSTLRHVKAVA